MIANFFKILAALVIGSQLARAEQTVIQISKTVGMCCSNQITFGDLATSRNIPTQVQHLIIADAPASGETVTWSGRDLAKKLRPYLSRLTDYKIKIPAFIRVTRLSGDSDQEDQVKKNIVTMLKTLLPGKDWTVELTSLQKLNWPDISAKTQWSVVPLNVRPRGAAQFEIVFNEEGKLVNHLWVNGEVKYTAPVPVIQKTVQAREKISESDIVWETRDVTYMTDVPASHLDLVTTVSRYALSVGTVITKNTLDRELAVKFGDEVDVLVGDDVVAVNGKGISQQNAYVGDMVRLKMVDGNKFLTGTAVGPKQIQVSF